MEKMYINGQTGLGIKRKKLFIAQYNVPENIH